jgi:dUTP pyrophosphatase
MDAPLLRIRKLRDDAQIPVYKRPGDAAFDLFSTEDWVLQPQEQHIFFIGIAMAIPEGHVGLIWDRSGMGAKHGIKTLGGVIDHTYRGEIGVGLINLTKVPYEIKKGDRIAQMLIQEVITADIREVENLDETQRGLGAFGSSGR